jgi:hypothetical protein
MSSKSGGGKHAGVEIEPKFYLEWRQLSTGPQGTESMREMAFLPPIRYNFPLFALPNQRGFFP